MTWAVVEAKAKFSKLIECANEQGPQEITRNGKVVGVLVSAEEWKKATRTGLKNHRSMSEFFRSSPLVDSGIDLTRSPSGSRKVDL